MARNDVAPAACSSAIVGARSAARALARFARASTSVTSATRRQSLPLRKSHTAACCASKPTRSGPAREAISERTKGGPGGRQGARKETGYAPDPAGAVERMRVARKAQAAHFAANVLPIIRDIQAAGFTSLNAIAGQLNARKVATANGGHWRHLQVRLILARAPAGERPRTVGRRPAAVRTTGFGY
jgi:hypothetical protein